MILPGNEFEFEPRTWSTWSIEVESVKENNASNIGITLSIILAVLSKDNLSEVNDEQY